MRIEVIATGEELLDGRVINSNLNEIADFLSPYGFQVTRCITVGDDPGELAEVFAACKERADVVLTTGGLGPTDDDRTAAILADLAGVSLERHADVLATLDAYFTRLQRPLVEANKKQADLPRGAIPLPNPKGTAPGIYLDVEGCHFFCLPGVSKEMRHLVEHEVLPRIRGFEGEQRVPPMFHTFKCFGAGESQFAELLRDLYPLPEGVDIGYRASFPEVAIRLSVACTTQPETDAALTSLKEAIGTRLKRYIYSEDVTGFSGSVGKALLAANSTLAMAESCTGGMVGQMMTADAGSSAYFLASMVTYCNEAKANILGVPQVLLDEYGAVSEPVALAMAEGARRVGNATIAGSITGVAGPGGGSLEKPVGTVHIAVTNGTKTMHRQFQFSGSRDRIRKLSAYAVLQLVRALLGEDDIPTTLER